jgi:hypothetical protein
VSETGLPSVAPAGVEETHAEVVKGSEVVHIGAPAEIASDTTTPGVATTIADAQRIQFAADKPRIYGSWFPGAQLDFDDPKQPLKWHLIAKVFARLPAASIHKVHKNLWRLSELGVLGGSHGIPVGTASSGSDCFMFVLEDLMALFEHVKFHHCFLVKTKLTNAGGSKQCSQWRKCFHPSTTCPRKEP